MTSWRIAGPYFESCNCEPICPCRRIDGRPGSRAQFRYCKFAVGWTVAEGYFDDFDLSGRSVVMVGYWDEDEPGVPWRVGVYADHNAADKQRDALAGIVTGRHEGTPARQYAALIQDVLFVERADIEIVHAPRGKQRLQVAAHVDVAAQGVFPTESTVTCGVPGHDRSGYELIVEHLGVHGDGLDFSFEGVCGFAATFDYRSDR